MNAFLKENFVLVLGIALPILLVIAVMGLQTVSKASVEPPQYGVVFAEPEAYYMRPWTFNVEDKTLVITYQEDNKPSHHNETSVWLHHYDPVSKKMERIQIQEPENYKDGEKVTIPVPAHFAALNLNADTKSPDGFKFSRPDYRSGSLFTEMFGYRSRNRDYRLHKNGVSFDLPDRDNRYRNTTFIGWVEHDQE